MMRRISIFVFLLCVIGGIYSQSNDVADKAFVLDQKYAEEYFRHYSRNIHSESSGGRLHREAKVLFFEAMEFYQNNNIEQAMKKLEDAIMIFPQESIFYYHYGVCLMDIRDYVNAEKSFLLALQFFYNDGDEKSSHDRYDFSIEPNPLYTFDQNNHHRETYFTYYNLACIYSIQNKLASSLNNLQKALEHRYPYINHIYTDSDMQNLLSSNADIKNMIVRYQNGDYQASDFSGRAFELWDLNDAVLYYFVDERNIEFRLLTSNDRNHVLFGTYEVNRNQITMHYTTVKGMKGFGYLPGGGMIDAFERYEPYENDINRTDFLNLAEVLSEWEEVPQEELNHYW